MKAKVTFYADDGDEGPVDGYGDWNPRAPEYDSVTLWGLFTAVAHAMKTHEDVYEHKVVKVEVEITGD